MVKDKKTVEGVIKDGLLEGENPSGGKKMAPNSNEDDQLSKKVLEFVDGYMEWRPNRGEWIEQKLHAENYQVPLIEFIESYGNTLVNKRVLDIGSGMGGFETTLALKGVDITGLEIIDIQLEITKLRLRKYGVRANLIKAYGEKMPIKDNTFDVVCLWSTIEHVEDPQQVLREVYRVLKPDGKVFMSFCNKWVISPEEHYFLRFIMWLPRGIAAKYVRLRGRAPGSEAYQGIAFEDMHYYSVPMFENLVFHIGFKKIESPSIPQKYDLQSRNWASRLIRSLLLIIFNIRRTGVWCKLEK